MLFFCPSRRELFFQISNKRETNLEGAGILQDASLGGDAVNGIISAALAADETAESNRGELTSVLTVGINVGNVDLDGSVVLGRDQAVGGGAGQREEESKKTVTETKF